MSVIKISCSRWTELTPKIRVTVFNTPTGELCLIQAFFLRDLDSAGGDLLMSIG